MITADLKTYASKGELKGAVQGTLVYLGLYFFCFVPFQAISKFYIYSKKQKEAKNKDGNEKISFSDIKYYNAKDYLALVGDRTVGNFIEFAILFLPLYWIHAIFVDPSQSFRIAALYTASRAWYPFAYNKRNVLWLLTSTVPGYTIYLYLFVEVARKV